MLFYAPSVAERARMLLIDVDYLLKPVVPMCLQLLVFNRAIVCIFETAKPTVHTK